MALRMMLDPIPEEREDLFNEAFDTAISEETIEAEAAQDADSYEKGQNRATLRLLKSFCRERDNRLAERTSVQLTSYITMLGKVMYKFANAKAMLAKLTIHEETISGLLHPFPTAPFKIALFNKQLEKTWIDAKPDICKLVLTNHVSKLVAVVKQYYFSLKVITAQETLLQLLVDPTVMLKHLELATSKLMTELKNLFKTRPIINVDGNDFMEKFGQIYNIDAILAALTSNDDI